MSHCKKSTEVPFRIPPPCGGCEDGLKVDGDHDLDPSVRVLVVLASCDEEEDDGVTVTLPCNPFDGERHTLIAAGQEITLDGGNFEVSQEKIAKGAARDVVFTTLSFDDCGACGNCGCKKRSSCDCPTGEWFVLGA